MALYTNWKNVTDSALNYKKKLSKHKNAQSQACWLSLCRKLSFPLNLQQHFLTWRCATEGIVSAFFTTSA